MEDDPTPDARELANTVPLHVPSDLPARPSLSYNRRFPNAQDSSDSEEGDDDGSPETLAQQAPGSRSGSIGKAIRDGAITHDADALGFHFERLIGRGGMGEVWEAVQARLGRIVAVKRLRPRGRDSDDHHSTAALHSFEGEALTAALLDHPNIVPVYDLGFDSAGRPLMAMKLVRGTNWQKVIERDFKALEPEDYLAKHLPIFMQVVQAVLFAHSRGVVHRDLKPTQVMIGEYGEVLLMDWGLAMMIGDPPSHIDRSTYHARYPTAATADNPSGTPGYMAPEQTEMFTTRIGPWTDIYLLGGTLYRLLTGKLPHPGRTSQEVYLHAAHGVVQPFAEAAPGRHVPADLERVAMWAMLPNPAERPTGREFADALQEFMTGSSNRRESERITDEMALEAPDDNYAAYVAGLAKLANAIRLWPGNHDVAPLRERHLLGYAKLALREGDLSLARAQAERLDDGEAKLRLLKQIDDAARAAALQKRRNQQLGLAAAAMLLVILGGGAVFTLRLSEANHATRVQLVLTSEARIAEADARRAAQFELRRATLLLAESLIAEDRLDDAVNELRRIPLEERGLEWRYLLTKALKDLWYSPYEYMHFSPSRRFVLGNLEGEGLAALLAEPGTVLAPLVDALPDGLVVAWSRDESLLALDAPTLPLTVWETDSWRVLRSEDPSTTDTVRAIDFSPDGRQLALGYESGLVTVMPLADGSERALARHSTPIIGVFWGETKLMTASPDELRRVDPKSGAHTLVYRTGAASVPFRPFKISANRQRTHVAFGHVFEKVASVGIEAGVPITYSHPAIQWSFSGLQQHLILPGFGFEPQVAVYDLETGQDVSRRAQPKVQAIDQNSSLHVANDVHYVDLSAAEDVALVLERRHDYALRNYPSFSALLNGKSVYSGREMDRVTLHPSGRALWVARPGGPTRTVPASSAWAGLPIPGSYPSFGTNDAYIAALQHESHDHFDPSTGERIFDSGGKFNIYRGSDMSEDRKRFLLPGVRSEKYTVRVFDYEKKVLLKEHVFDFGFRRAFFSAEKSTIGFLAPDGTNAEIYSLSGDSPVLLIEMKAEAEDIFTFGSSSPDGATYYLGTMSGRLCVVDAAKGTVLREFEPTPNPILLISQRLDGHLVVIDNSNIVTLVSAIDGTMVNRVPFSFEPQGLAVSRAGDLVASWSESGQIEVRRLGDGTVVSQSKRTDFPLFALRFVGGDSRLMAYGDGEARLFDPATGEDIFTIRDGFGSLSASEDMYLAEVEAGRISALVSLAPKEAFAEVGAAGSDSADAALHRWRLDRYRTWHQYAIRHRVHPGWSAGAAVLEPGAVPALRDFSYLFSIGEVPANDTALRFPRTRLELFAAFTLAADLFRSPIEDGFTEFPVLNATAQAAPELFNGPVGSAAILIGSAYSRRLEESPRIDSEVWAFASLLRHQLDAARALAERGDREAASAVLLRAAAHVRLADTPTGDWEYELRRLGLELPVPPPAELVRGPNMGSPPFVLERMAMLDPMAPLEVRAAVAKQAADEYAERAREYLDRVAPLVDWDALVARHAPFPEDSPVREGVPFGPYIAERLPDLERGVLGGLTLDEALEAERRRIEELFAPPAIPDSGSRVVAP
ncbi:MAG: protein kinase [Candidatus Sumerlaeia bacterium]|nr:protein kinase [Candidatus Sumerlaeia bacterium]